MKIGMAFEAVAPTKNIKVNISFLPTGKIDYSAPFSMTNNVVLEKIFQSTFDNLTITYDEYWELIGRMFYVLHWLCLADLGQKTTVNQQSVGPNSDPNGVQAMLPNLFVNETLYNDYMAYFPEVSQVFHGLKINASTYFNYNETDFA
jgi:hypothetical protein